MIQFPGSTLPPQVLKLGFTKMNNKRKLWLDDIEAGLFKLEKRTQPGNNENNDQSHTAAQVTNTQDPDLNNTAEKIVDFEEWNGFGEADLDDV